MRVAVVLLVLAAAVAALALWAAIAFGREYGTDTFWGALAWGAAFTLVPLVPGNLIIGRSRRNRS